PVTYPHSKALREVARKAPLNRLLLETDAPHLSPVPKRGQKNEPAFVHFTAREVARLRNISYEKLAEATSQNAYRAYNLDR
ncbi:MAG: TatD family hydrolase, partial [Desulfobacterales bacterium]|nr:TatD family hydrolase [Desulfobacterales bacterium]